MVFYSLVFKYMSSFVAILASKQENLTKAAKIAKIHFTGKKRNLPISCTNRKYFIEIV